MSDCGADLCFYRFKQFGRETIVTVTGFRLQIVNDLFYYVISDGLEREMSFTGSIKKFASSFAFYV